MFEVIYRYKEQAESGYSEETKEKKSKIGNPYEDVSLEVAAGKIMAQLARRDILIVDVEIYEYSKKQISYKQNEDGIVIKNKKFRFDDGPVVSGEPELDAEKLLEIIQANPQLLTGLRNLSDAKTPPTVPPKANPKVSPKDISTALAIRSTATKRARPIRFEVFNPSPQDMAKAKAKGLKLTLGKKYPIWEEKGDGIRMVYHIVDDGGREIDCGAECFEVVTSGRLLHEDAITDPREKEAVNLWGGHRVEENADQMPILRR